MAAQNVSGNVLVNAGITQTDSAGLINAITASGSINYNQALNNGTGAANQIDTLYSSQLTLAGAATHINLHAATDPLGNAVVFARVRFWAVQVLTLTAGFICNVYTRVGTDPVTWLPQVTTATLWCTPGGIISACDPGSTTTNGWVVSASAFDFTLDPGANTIIVNVTIAGNSAA